MKETEADIFIRETGKVGDVWTKEQVMDVYQGVPLVTALAERQKSYDRISTMIYSTAKDNLEV